MKTIVIGGGAAGMMAAYFSAKGGNETVIIEKNEKLGKKLYITGKGRCNLTNDCEIDEFFNNVVTNPRFLSSAIYAYPPQKIMSLMEENGLPLKVERGKRVFPVSDKSSDVIKTLVDMCKFSGVTVKLNETVEKINVVDGSVTGVETDLGSYGCDKVVVATGGCSYALTGSTGDGYKFARDSGHTVINPVQALVPLLIKGDYCERLAGLSLKNVTFVVKRNGKVICNELGEMLFTHVGVSGPLVLTASSRINRFDKSELETYIDFKPALSEAQLDARILRDFETLKNRALKNSLDMLLPSSLIPVVIERSKIPEMKRNNEITRAERGALVSVIKRFVLEIDKLAPFAEAIITSGGVSVKEINPKTLESKLVKGLYFAGEVIDVDALTGGFNLQIAFATGAKAGENSL